MSEREERAAAASPKSCPSTRRSCSQWGRGSRGRRTRGRPAWGSGAAPRAGWNWRERGSWGGARWLQTRKAPPGRERNWGKLKGSSTCVKLSPARVSEWRLEVCKFARIASTCSTLNPLLLNPTTLRWQTALATPDTLSWNGKLKKLNVNNRNTFPNGTESKSKEERPCWFEVVIGKFIECKISYLSLFQPTRL